MSKTRTRYAAVGTHFRPGRYARTVKLLLNAPGVYWNKCLLPLGVYLRPAFIRDPAFIGTASKTPAFIKDQRLIWTRRLIEVLVTGILVVVPVAVLRPVGYCYKRTILLLMQL